MTRQDVQVRPLAPQDRAAWEPLWRGYQEFYHAQLSPEQTDLTWAHFHYPNEPMFALGAFVEGELRGIVHYIFHRSCWTPGPCCYLQDLFTAPAFRGAGPGRKLIEAVYAAAGEAGAGRVYWLTHETNTDAMLLYDRLAERTGFVQYRRIFLSQVRGL